LAKWTQISLATSVSLIGNSAKPEKPNRLNRRDRPDKLKSSREKRRNLYSYVRPSISLLRPQGPFLQLKREMPVSSRRDTILYYDCLTPGPFRGLTLKSNIIDLTPSYTWQEDLCSGDRKSLVSKARSVISYVAVREIGYSGVEVGRVLTLSGAGVTKCVEKGKAIISSNEDLAEKLIS